jgi:hypothetical protein
LVRNLTLNFSHSFKGKIWSLNTDDQGTFLVIEERDESIMEVAFHILDFKTFALRQTITLEEKWWIAIVHVSRECILFKTYSADGNPEVKSIICWNIKNRKEAWINNEFKNIEILNDQILSRDEDELKYYDLETGSVTDVRSKELNIFENKITKPIYYPISNEYFSLISRFLTEVLNETIVVGAEYLEGNGFITISYYTKESKLANKLLVVDMNKEILLHKTLGKEISGIGQDTFFIQDNNLIFTVEKTEFFIYQLP